SARPALAAQECDGDAVAALALLARPELLDRLVRRQVAADRGAQRAGAVAVDDEDRVAPGHQALVDEAIDLGHCVVDPVAADVERGVDRARVGPAAGGDAVDELDAVGRPAPGVVLAAVAVAAIATVAMVATLATLRALGALAAALRMLSLRA